MHRMSRLASFSIIALCAVGVVEARADGSDNDFGAVRDKTLTDKAKSLFGFEKQLDSSSTASVDAATAGADPTSLITVAKGLKVRVVSAAANLGANTDQMAFWPNDTTPTHLIVMNEQGTAQPGIQRIRLSDGLVETILTGTTSGDPMRRTAWGTILAGEENGTTGQMIEIINPLATTNVIYDRVAGTATNGAGGAGAENVTPRWALGRLSFEGLAILPNGVVYFGDENRPSGGAAGGAYYKFVPTSPFTGSAPITSLAQSPLAAGQVYGLKLSRGTNNGQGNNTGQGVWVLVPSSNNANLRAAAPTLGLSGFYRPEDLEIDQEALAAGNVRACGNNTGNETDRNFGETICITDGTVAGSTTNAANPEVQFFVMGTPEFAMPDNLAQHPTKKFWAINEDGEGPVEGRNNDIWACLRDGSDFDLLSDGCLRFATLNDLTAESTGGIFDGTGAHYYVSVQHNVTGHGVVLDISGWKD
jgi:hypothetical protein